MKKIILTLLLAAMTLGVIADPVSSSMAVRMANAWATKNAAFGVGARATGAVSTVYDPTNATIVLWHQVTLKNGGMLVIAPVTEIEPVVMALEKDPGELPTAHPLRGILTGDMRRRLQFLGLYSSAATRGGASLASATPASTTTTTTATTPAATTNETALAWGKVNDAKWKRLLASSSSASLLADSTVSAASIEVNIRTVKGFEQGGALTHWNQSSYMGSYLYNYYTPGHAVCGCVATATAALAQFYGTTNAVSGITKNCTYNGAAYPSTTIGGAIDWSILPENFGGTNSASFWLTTEQRELIGRVAYDAGVGVSMMWGDEESAAFEYDMVTALKDVFGFRNARCVSFQSEENPSQTALEKLIYNQCRAGVPVGISIKGHSVVVVGYGLDSENVERVRVFMGWAGSGDGWYALPKIDTKSTLGGSTYLSEIVDQVITMISYADDDIVPIVGHVALTNATLKIEALDRTFTSSELGYFGTRVPATIGDVTVTCNGHPAECTVGEKAATATDEATLCAEGVLPDAFEFFLLNSSVAYSLKKAKIIAEREGKAILRVNGNSEDESVKALVDSVVALDEANTGNFTNLFVYYFSSIDSSAGDGAEVSYGVYLPRDLDEEERWQAQNGALAYGYVSTLTLATNVTHDVTHVAETNGLAETTATYNTVTTFAPIDAEVFAVTNNVDEVSTNVLQEAMLESFYRVVGLGGVRFSECTSGITVTIGAPTAEAEAAIDAVADEANKTGLHENCYTNGTYTFTCAAEVTNETAGVVWDCTGWTVTNLTTGAASEGEGCTATLDLAVGDEIALTWNCETNAVYITVLAECQNSRGAAGTFACEPGSGWYTFGKSVTFTASCSDDYVFSNFTFSNGEQVEGSSGYSLLSAMKVLVWPQLPTTLTADFRKVKAGTGGATVEATTNITLTATSVFLADDAVHGVGDDGAPAAGDVPATTVFAATNTLQLASGDTATFAVVTHDDTTEGTVDYCVEITPPMFTDANGREWELIGCVPRAVTMFDTADRLSAAAEELPGNALSLRVVETTVAFTWVWSLADGSDDEPVTTEFDIAWDAALTTLNARGYATNLISLAALEKEGKTIDDLTVTVPNGFKVKLATARDATSGEEMVQATLDVDEETLRPKAVEGESAPLTIFPNANGSITVKAAVANGVKGFWYALQTADDLNGDWSVVTTGYVSGTPVAQAPADDVTVNLSIDVEPTVARKFYKLVVSREKPAN